MILEALRRSVVRLFRKSDTSLPPQIGPDFLRLVVAAHALGAASKPSPKPAPSRPGAKPPADPEIHRTQQACAGAGIVPSSTSHAHHDDDGPPELILTRSIDSVMEGKPERLS